MEITQQNLNRDAKAVLSIETALEQGEAITYRKGGKFANRTSDMG